MICAANLQAVTCPVRGSAPEASVFLKSILEDALNSDL